MSEASTNKWMKKVRQEFETKIKLNNIYQRWRIDEKNVDPPSILFWQFEEIQFMYKKTMSFILQLSSLGVTALEPDKSIIFRFYHYY